MTLRETFLEDPFFKSSWEDMERFRDHFFQQSQDMRRAFSEDVQKIESKQETSSTTSGTNGRIETGTGNTETTALAPGGRDWLMPRRWMMPSLFEENFKMGATDSNVISLNNDDKKMEISLNTTGYKPDELKVNIANDAVTIEGRHEEKSESGHTMVARQFSKSYSLPVGAKKEEVVSNLSQDGVMVITIPKEKKIQEIKDDKHEQRSNAEQKTSSVESRERKISSESRERVDKSTETRVPMTMRNSFLEDPFFKPTWSDIESNMEDFFKNARQSFDESVKRLETETKSFGSARESSLQNTLVDRDNRGFRKWMMPSIFDKDDFLLEKEDLFTGKDNNQIRLVNDAKKMEISLDTAGYKPDELKVNIGNGEICVEGKHEEKTEAGQVMVSRRFCRNYTLPKEAKVEEVASNLSQDGVLVITVPKLEALENKNRSVPISV